MVRVSRLDKLIPGHAPPPSCLPYLEGHCGFTHTEEGRAEVEIPQPELSKRLFLPSTVMSLKKSTSGGMATRLNAKQQKRRGCRCSEWGKRLIKLP